MLQDKPIVVVSADPETQQLCSQAVRQTRRVALAVDSWRAALALARERGVGLVLMDVLTAADWQRCRILRDGLPTGEVPVVALSGWGAPDSRYRTLAWSVGCAAYISKPCSAQTLLATIDRVENGEVGVVAGPQP